MKILLLGSNGQLGSDILRFNKKLVKPFEFIPWTRKDLDVQNTKQIEEKLASIEFDCLINCISYTNTEKAEKNIQDAFEVNAFCIKEMVKACKNNHAKFFQISTDYIFSHGSTPLTECAAPSPLSVYGASKLLGESLALSLYENVTVFRVASLFGIAGASGKGGNFVETMIRVGNERGRLTVISDQIMSPTSTADLANLILKALTVSIPNGIYNAVNTGNTSWYQFAKLIIEKADVNAKVEPILGCDYPSAILRPSYSALDNSKLTKLIGNIPTWEDALTRYLEEKGHISYELRKS